MTDGPSGTPPEGGVSEVDHAPAPAPAGEPVVAASKPGSTHTVPPPTPPLPVWGWVVVALVPWLMLLPELSSSRALTSLILQAWYVPIWDYVGHVVGSGHMPLWHPHLLNGFALVGHPDVGLFYPFNLLMWLSGLAPERALAWTGAFHLTLAGLGYTYLLRSWGCRNTAAMFGGLLVATASPYVVYLHDPARIEVLAWWPWLLAFLLQGRVLSATLILGMQVLAGDWPGVFAGMIVAAIVVMVKGDVSGLLSPWLSVVLAGHLLGAMQWLPYLDMLQHSLRRAWPGPLPEQPTLSSVTTLVGAEWGAAGDRFVPIIAILLLLFAFGRFRQAPWSQAALGLVACAVFGFIAALGAEGPLRAADALVARHVALQEAIGFTLLGDEPVRWADYLILSIMLLAALGLDALWPAENNLAPPGLGPGLGAVAVVCALVFGRMNVQSIPMAEFHPPAQVPQARALLGGVQRAATEADIHPLLASYLAAAPQGPRQIGGYTRIAPQAWQQFATYAAVARTPDRDDVLFQLRNGHRLPAPGLSSRLMQAAGVEAVLYVSSGGVLARRSLEPLDRFSLVASFDVLSDSMGGPSVIVNETLLERLDKAEHNPRRVVLLEESPDMESDTLVTPLPPQEGEPPPPPLPEPLPGATIKVVEDTPQQLRLVVNSPRQALLVIRDGYHEGWKARVNGRREVVLRADGSVRAVKVPQGTSDVSLVFQPDQVQSGIALSILTLVGMALAALRPMELLKDRVRALLKKP